MIDRNELLADFLVRLDAAPWLTLDTEADSLHAYPEKLCLIQISIAGEDRLIDPLSGLSLAGFFGLVRDREIIMHGSDYDLRLFRKWHSFVPTRIFDTMIAARLLGEPHFGLHALVKKFLAIDLDKGPQKAWIAQKL